MDWQEHEERFVVEYVNLEAPDLTVTLAEKVASEFVYGQRHDVWDVHTVEDGRYWVVTNLTNLYRQVDFPSMDACVTFHLGLNLRIRARHAKESGISDPPPAARLWEQAAEALDQAVEIEDFQAVAMRCREALIAWAKGMIPTFGGSTDDPKAGDVVAWAARVAQRTTQRERLRTHAVSLATTTWNLAQQLTHSKTVSPMEASIVVGATADVMALFDDLIDPPIERKDACGNCGSRSMAQDYLRDSGITEAVCEKCGWRTVWKRPHGAADRMVAFRPTEPPEGECITVDEPISGPRVADVASRRKPV